MHGETSAGLTCTGSSPTDFPDASGQVIKTCTARPGRRLRGNDLPPGPGEVMPARGC